MTTIGDIPDDVDLSVGTASGLAVHEVPPSPSVRTVRRRIKEISATSAESKIDRQHQHRHRRRCSLSPSVSSAFVSCHRRRTPHIVFVFVFVLSFRISTRHLVVVVVVFVIVRLPLYSFSCSAFVSRHLVVDRHSRRCRCRTRHRSSRFSARR